MALLCFLLCSCCEGNAAKELLHMALLCFLLCSCCEGNAAKELLHVAHLLYSCRALAVKKLLRRKC